MVNIEPWLYLLIGQDILAKDAALAKIKESYLAKKLTDFNLDTLYAKELSLKGLQERLLCLPINAKKRIIVIKDAQGLKEEVKKFLYNYCKAPLATIIMVMDISQRDSSNDFINIISKFAKVLRFKEDVRTDTFMLFRAISQKKADNALKILNQLLKSGEKPERILGGLRYSCAKDALNLPETKKRLKLLIDCDIEIKTGRLKPDFALEKLVVSLCGLTKFPG